jgi:hypothetical protein
MRKVLGSIPSSSKIPSNWAWSSWEVDFLPAFVCPVQGFFTRVGVGGLLDLWAKKGGMVELLSLHSGSSDGCAVAGRKDLSAHETHYYKTSSRATITLFIQ